jgi:SAM-dependent methyltransferase
LTLARKFRLLFKPLHKNYYGSYKNVIKADLSRMSIYKNLKAEIASTPGPVLDFGCGTGYVTSFLEAEGVDINKEAIELAAKNFPKTSFKCAGMAEIALSGKKYAAVTCVNVVEHLEDAERGLFFADVQKLLGPGGRFYVVYDDMYHPLQLLSGIFHPGMLLTDPTHVHCWTQKEFGKILGEHFKILKTVKGNILSHFLPFTNSFATARLYVCGPK